MSSAPNHSHPLEKSKVRAALYLRVSTKEQTAENQESSLRAWAERLGAEVVRVYADTVSGARSDRDALRQMLAAAHRREFDTLLIWSLDRLSREGIGPTLRYLESLHALGIRVVSEQESWLDTAGPMWELFAAVSAFWAKLERARHVERVQAGLARAKTQGTRSGRPIGRPRRPLDLAEISRRRAVGESWRRISRALKIPLRTVRRARQNLQAKCAPEIPSHG